jgi:hypothetical protein
MTLVLALSNSEVTIQIADGRLTSLERCAVNANPLDDLAVKAGLLLCGDARLAYSFAGLAFTGTFAQRTFDTRLWLRRAILEAADPFYQAQPIVDKLRELLTAEFQTNREILKLPKSSRRLSVMLAGVLNTIHGGMHTSWVLTNYQQSFDAWGVVQADRAEAHEEFAVASWQQPLSLGDAYAHIERLGTWRAVSDTRMLRLAELLAERRPVPALVDAGVKALQSASDSHRSLKQVGKEASVLIIPTDHREPCSGRSGVGSARKSLHRVPDWLVATGPNERRWVSLEFEKVADPGKPYSDVSTPRVRRNAPCPCGSGYRYRDCHKNVLRPAKA